MPLWHWMIGAKCLMEQYKEDVRSFKNDVTSVLDFLSRLGQRQSIINHAIDGVAEANRKLAEAETGFGPLMAQAQELLDANPEVECVECPGANQVLVRMPAGGGSLFALSHWSELELPKPKQQAPCLCRNGGGFTSLSGAQIDSLSQDAHDRIQSGTTTAADREAMALSDAWVETFDDPNMPGEVS